MRLATLFASNSDTLMSTDDQGSWPIPHLQPSPSLLSHKQTHLRHQDDIRPFKVFFLDTRTPSQAVGGLIYFVVSHSRQFMINENTEDVHQHSADSTLSRMQRDASCSCSYQIIKTPLKTGEDKARGDWCPSAEPSFLAVYIIRRKFLALMCTVLKAGYTQVLLQGWTCARDS